MIGVEESLQSGRYVVALEDIPAGTPIHTSTAYCHGRFIPPMRAAPGNKTALYPNHHCSYCTKSIQFGDEIYGKPNKNPVANYSAAVSALRCPVCRTICYCSEECLVAHSERHRDSLECLAMGLILKGREWYDKVYFPTYADKPSLLAASNHVAAANQKRPAPVANSVATSHSHVVEIVTPILPATLFEKEVFSFLMMACTMALRAAKELVVVEPVKPADGEGARVQEGDATSTAQTPVVMYSGLAREVPYRYLGSKLKHAPTTPEPMQFDALHDPVESLPFPTVAEIVTEVEVPTAMPPTSPITDTSVIPVEAGRIIARFKELGGVEVVDSVALAKFLAKEGVANITEHMRIVLKNCQPTIQQPPKGCFPIPRTDTNPHVYAPVAFTIPHTYVPPAWGDVAALTTNLSVMRKDGPFSRYRTLYRLYCRCRAALSKCKSSPVVPVDGKAASKRGGKKPGSRPSKKTPEEIEALRAARDAKRRKVDKKDTTEEERSLGNHGCSPTKPPASLSDDDDQPPPTPEVDKFADSLLPYISESMFLSICAGIQCNTFSIDRKSVV